MRCTGSSSQSCGERTYRRAMDNRSEVREFLTSRRAKLTPEQSGLPDFGGERRVPGLRREEVAMLAGLSTEYYARFERGNLAGASDSVLEALARALKLGDAEREHLFDLARTANASSATRARRRPPRKEVRPHLQRILDAMTGAPAFVRNGRLDVLATNELGRALYSEAFVDGTRPVNLARFAFLDPRAVTLYPDWKDAADTSVALLHTEAGRDPYNKDLTDLVGELSTLSREFRVRWAEHEVRLHHIGVKHFRHPAVGPLDLTFEAMALPAETGLTLTTYSAEPGTPSEDGLKLLASWSASQDWAQPSSPSAAEHR